MSTHHVKTEEEEKERTYCGVPARGVRHPVAAWFPCRGAICSADAAATEGLLSGAPQQARAARSGAYVIRLGHVFSSTVVAP